MIVKFTYPHSWNFFKDSLPALIGYKTENLQIEINNDCDFCDLWVVWGDLNMLETVGVSAGFAVFIAEEAYPEKKYPRQFLEQFNYVFGTREDIEHSNFIRTHYTGTWFVKRSFSDLQDNIITEKSKDLSVVSSSLTILEGHKKRFAFVNRMIGHFKDKIDVFGRGYNEIDDKALGLAKYKYSIAIENSVIPDYFTEKIWDCYLSNTMPFYYGCPNIEQYFPSEAFIKIDIDDFKTSIKIIEEAIESDRYSKSLPHLIDARNRVLYHYTIFPYLTYVIQTVKYKNKNFKKVKLKNIEFFEQRKPRLYNLFR